MLQRLLQSSVQLKRGNLPAASGPVEPSARVTRIAQPEECACLVQIHTSLTKKSLNLHLTDLLHASLTIHNRLAFYPNHVKHNVL